MTWRGAWECDACSRTVAWSEFEGERPDGRMRLLAQPDGALLGELARAVPIFSSHLAHKSASSPSDSEKRADHREWLAMVEGVTSPFRLQRAARHRRLSAGAPVGHPERLTTYDWHEQRRVAQGERFQRINACGTVTHALETYCPDTGELHEARPFKFTCRVWRLCPHCLKRRQTKLAKGVELVRPAALRARRLQLSKHYKGREGRWSERLLTVTVPHSGDAAEDARQLRRAIPEFTRRVAEHLKKDVGCSEKMVYVRGIEVAPSEDGGHAHAHFWLLSPFIEHSVLRVTWGRVLEALGVKCPRVTWDYMVKSSTDKRAARWNRTRRGPHGRAEDEVPWPIVDVRGATGAAEYAAKVGVANYVVKGAKVQRMHPLHAGNVYAALEGARAVVWARGWAPKPTPDAMFYKLRPLTEDEKRKWVSSVEPTEKLCAARVAEATGPPFQTTANDVDSTQSKTPPSPERARPQQTLLPFDGSSGRFEG